VAAALGQAGVDGCFYWYDNNWHYLRQWDHFKKLKAAATPPVRLCEKLPDYESISVPGSDRIIGRLISMQIKLSWTEEELSRRIEKVRSVFGM